MTDKIIIDGTQCRYAHFDGGNTQRLLCAIDDCFCDCYRENECYYKQLKRKEQECEELKERLNCKCFDPKSNNNRCISYNRIAEDYGRDLKQLDQLKAENERLKKKIKIYNCIDKWGTEQCRCACRCLSNEFCDAAEEKMKNIKQTLAEINRMAENTYCLTNTTNKDMANFAKQIFQKISEVEK